MDLPGSRARWLETGRDRQARVGPGLEDRTIVTTRRQGEPERTVGDRLATALFGVLCAFLTTCLGWLIALRFIHTGPEARSRTTGPGSSACWPERPAAWRVRSG